MKSFLKQKLTMISKEDILNKVRDEVESFYKVKNKFSQNADLIRRVASKTLNVADSEFDSYAKEIAIGFFKWVWFETKWELTKEGWYKDRGDDFDPIYITDDELYQEYLSYLNTLKQ